MPYCEYCLVNKTNGKVRATDGADYPCCKSCKEEVILNEKE